MEKLEDTLQTLVDSYSEAALEVNEYGMLPIHAACMYYPRNAKVIEILIRANPAGAIAPVKLPVASPSTKPKMVSSLSRKYLGSFPIHVALSNGASADVINQIIEADPQALGRNNKNGLSPLVLALKHRAEADVVEALLRVNESLTRISDKRMNYPLHLACMYGCSVGVVKALFEAFPAVADLPNRDGLKPIDLAQRSGKSSDDLMNMLQEVIHGEKKSATVEIAFLESTNRKISA